MKLNESQERLMEEINEDIKQKVDKYGNLEKGYPKYQQILIKSMDLYLEDLVGRYETDTREEYAEKAIQKLLLETQENAGMTGDIIDVIWSDTVRINSYHHLIERIEEELGLGIFKTSRKYGLRRRTR